MKHEYIDIYVPTRDIKVCVNECNSFELTLSFDPGLVVWIPHKLSVVVSMESLTSALKEKISDKRGVGNAKLHFADALLPFDWIELTV